MTQAAPQTPDPWKSFRGVMAGTLILEVITVLLALPVVSAVGGGLTPWSTAYLLGFSALLVLLAGVQGRNWAIWANLSAQLLLVLGFFIYPAIGFMGVIFGVVWGVIAYLRYEVRRRQRLGLLPGQQPPADHADTGPD
jgi:predicted membrane protein